MSNLDTVQNLYAAFSAGDFGTVSSLMHPDIEWVQMDGFPGGGVHVGIDTVVREVFTRLRADWENWRAIVAEYLDAGDTVVALGYYAGTHKRTGKSMQAAFAHCYTLREGRVGRFVQYTDTLRVAEAAWLSAPAKA